MRRFLGQRSGNILVGNLVSNGIFTQPSHFSKSLAVEAQSGVSTGVEVGSLGLTAELACGKAAKVRIATCWLEWRPMALESEVDWACSTTHMIASPMQGNAPQNERWGRNQCA